MGRLRFWEPMHPKLGHLHPYSFHNRGSVTCVYQKTLWPREPIFMVNTVVGPRLSQNHNLPEGRLLFWEPRHPKFGHICHYSFRNRGYATCVYQIALWPSEPILLVHTVQCLDCHKIIICQRDTFVSGNQGTPNLAIYTTIHSRTDVM